MRLAAMAVAGWCCASLALGELADDLPIERPGPAPVVRTLAEIKASGTLRILVRNSATSFLVYRGHRLGFDYELGKRLAQSLGVRAQFVVPPLWEEIIPALLRGDGDVIAGEMTVTDERSKEVLFAQPYLTTSERVVSHRSSKKVPPIAAPEDLSGRQVTVRRSSAYWQSLEALNARLARASKAPVELVAADEDAETEDLLDLGGPRGRGRDRRRRAARQGRRRVERRAGARACAGRSSAAGLGGAVRGHRAR